MDAHLHDSNGNLVATVQVPVQRAYPPFVAYDGAVYQCRNVASAAGDYDLVGRVHVVEVSPTSGS